MKSSLISCSKVTARALRLLAACGSAGVVLGLHAADTLTLQNTAVGNGQTANHQANVSITATNNYTVASGGQANLTAGISITLKSDGGGVRIYSGGGLHAMIDFNRNGTSDWQEESVAVAPPYFTSFEAADGFVLATINGQGGWFAGPGVSVTASAASDGMRSVTVPTTNPTSSLTKHFRAMSGQPVTYVDFFLKPVFTGSLNFSSYLDLASAQIGFLQAGAGGRLQVLTSSSQGAAQWLTVGPSIPLDGAQRSANWLRLTLRVNYSTLKWDLFLDGLLVASSLPLNSTNAHLPFFTLYGSTVADTFFDDIYLGSSNPLPADTAAPTTPTNLATPSVTSSSVNLFWTPSTGAIGVAGYNIYRNGTLIGTTSGLQTYFTDQNLNASTSYTYTVQAFNSGGVASGQSSSVVAATAASTTPSLEVFSPLK